MILDWLDHYGSITQKDAPLFGCARLASRIWDLRRMGYNIVRKIVYYRNRNDELKHYAEYRMEVAMGG
jgi:hypothetical protein